MVSDWLMANKVSLNIDKTNFIIFHPPQKVKGHIVKLVSLSNYDDDHNDDFKKTIGLMIKTTALHVHHAF